jgi:hypothetical protein
MFEGQRKYWGRTPVLAPTNKNNDRLVGPRNEIPRVETQTTRTIQTLRRESSSPESHASKETRRHRHYLLESLANALCTSDRDIPNSRAILAAVTPALKAARTAFNFPCGKEEESTSAFRCLLSGASGPLRRVRSWSAADTSLSSC